MSSDNYYEDADPRFAEASAQPNIPTVLVPGNSDPYAHHPNHPQFQASASYDSVQDGPLSEASHFTSISERGENPQWRAEQQQRAGYGMGGIPNRQPPPHQQQRDFLLAGNPDFEIPVGGRGRGGPAGRGGFRGPPPSASQMGGMI
jgi:hypothetical protein